MRTESETQLQGETERRKHIFVVFASSEISGGGGRRERESGKREAAQIGPAARMSCMPAMAGAVGNTQPLSGASLVS